VTDDQADSKLIQLAQRLGADAAARLDVERAVQGVLRGLRQQRAHERRGPTLRLWWAQPAWLRAAAVITLLAGAGLVTQRLLGPEGSPPAPVEAASEDLNALSADQLRQVLELVDRPLDVQRVVTAQDAGLEDLSVPQLRDLLQSLEG